MFKINAMKKTNIFPIFYPIGGRTYDKTTPEFKQAYNKPGVYMIFRLQPGGIMPIYCGKGENAGKACIRHFYYYNDIEQKKGGGKDEEGNFYNKKGQYRVSFENEKRTVKFFVKFWLFPEGTDMEKVKKKESEIIKAVGPKYNINLKTGKPDKEFKAELIEEAEEAADEYAEYKKQVLAAQDEEVPF